MAWKHFSQSKQAQTDKCEILGDVRTGEIEEGVEDVKSVGVVPLDELVGVVFLNVFPVRHKQSRASAATNGRFGEIRPLILAILPSEEAEAVTADQDVPVGIHLQEVSVQGVDH